MFGDEKFPPPYVPDGGFARAAGAAVDVDGTVACVTCAVRLPLVQADVVGEGTAASPATARRTSRRSRADRAAGAHFSRKKSGAASGHPVGMAKTACWSFSPGCSSS
jgi:hypothetical protein